MLLEKITLTYLKSFKQSKELVDVLKYLKQI